MSQSSPSLIRNFTIAYVTALILIAGLVIGSTTMLAIATSEQIGDAAILNISGKQRMLSQRIAQFAQRRIHGQTTELSENLIRLAREMITGHDALIKGDEDLGIMSPAPPSAQVLYFQEPHNLDSRVRAYVNNAIALANVADGGSEEALGYIEAIQNEAKGPPT